MNRKPRNDETDSKHNVYELGKVHFWEKYGVQRFPYRGRRRYSPCVYRSVDGGIIVSNDVFGLTIRQFERMFKACLIRRKTHEQYILNLRYPVKTSDEYLEYLQDSIVNNKDYASWTGNNMKERYLYEHLLNTAGTETDKRKRQQLFITMDMINNVEDSELIEISSGSLAEGLDLPGSDIDIMYVFEDVDVIRDVRNIKHLVQRTTLVMETDNNHPGFSYLRLIIGGEGDSQLLPLECFESAKKGLYLSVNTFVSDMNKENSHYMLSSHGPCLSTYDQSMDIAFCLRSKYLPYNALPWATRSRMQWPPNSVIDEINKYGCLLVPIGPRTLPDCNALWRLSFSVAEKQLVHSFNFTQLLCYCLLKLTLKHIINTNRHAEGLLCSYFLKTALFWVSEEIDIETFRLSNLYFCFSNCVSKLILWVNNCYCPNYFIPEQNMFLGKISPDNNEILMNVLYNIKHDGIDGLIHNLYQHDNEHHQMLSTQLEPSFIKLDLLFYRISFSSIYGIREDYLPCLKVLEFTESLLKSKSSTFIVDVCRYRHAEISQCAAQLLPALAVTTESYRIHKRYHRHLQDGTKTDAVSGWLLYASFYYVTEQFKVTLKLTDYVLSRYSSNMLLLGCHNYHDGHINLYRNYVHSTMSLHEKMKMAVVQSVVYVKHSSLIPKELQLEVKDQFLCISPSVMSHCLRFLCYHHIGDIFNRKQALLDLYLSVKERQSIGLNTLSNSITILGVCYEISDDKDTAYHCYEKALQCKGIICRTAKTRKSNLFTD
ncbi:uncharacterized protein LOC143054915 [Mytilus galloprovincialis]|uniref:uncharacterized protein LOC143054915 n=1 Tax=Mytilus galloprovincialis TaxID=29158 RepID=UPI003F7B3D95